MERGRAQSPWTQVGCWSTGGAAFGARTASIQVGDVLRVQGWYRDTDFPPPGNANLTHGIDGITIL